MMQVPDVPPETAPPPMQFQLHWEDMADETAPLQYVASFLNWADVEARAHRVVKHRGIPPRHRPVILREDEPRYLPEHKIDPLVVADAEALGDAVRAEAAEARDAANRGLPFRYLQPKTGRNEPCPCGRGTKYKKCHGRLARV